MSNPKGTRFETRLVNYLVERLQNPSIERRARNGKNDRGDVAGLPLVIEAKNVKRIDLAGWMDEAIQEAKNAGVERCVVIFPRRNHAIGRAYVLMELDQFIKEMP